MNIQFFARFHLNVLVNERQLAAHKTEHIGERRKLTREWAEHLVDSLKAKIEWPQGDNDVAIER